MATAFTCAPLEQLVVRDLVIASATGVATYTIEVLMSPVTGGFYPVLTAALKYPETVHLDLRLGLNPGDSITWKSTSPIGWTTLLATGYVFLS